MVPLTDPELVALAQDLESDRVERKRDWSGSAPDKIREAVCAFANDLPNHRKPGVILIGVEDNGVVANIIVTEQLLQSLASIKSDGRIVPPPTVTVERRIVNKAEVAVMMVLPADAGLSSIWSCTRWAQPTCRLSEAASRRTAWVARMAGGGRRRSRCCWRPSDGAGPLCRDACRPE